MKHKRIGLTFLFSCLFFVLFATDIWVSTDGNDRNDGSAKYPLNTLHGAIHKAREMRRINIVGVDKGINIILKEGVYYLYEPVNIRPEDSGTTASPTIISAEDGADVVISGGIPITEWKDNGKYWVADVPDFNGRPLDFRQLWINGKKAVRARDVVDFEGMNRILHNDIENQLLWVPAKAVEDILNAPYAEMILHQMWCISNLRIKSIDVSGDSAAVRFHNPESKLQFVRPWPSPMTTPGSESAFYLTNAIELLDQPGEWFHDFKEQKLYYLPRENEDINNFEAIVPAIETLVEINGTLDRPVENIKFKNIQFSHTTWMRPSEKGHVPLQAGMYLTEAYRMNPIMKREGNHNLDNQGWLGRPAAAVTLSGTKDIDFDRCVFTHLASTGLDYKLGNKGGKVEGSLFKEIGGNGIVIGSFSPSAHETHFPFNPRDLREVCSYQKIVNNLFEDVTNEDWGCVAIAAGYVNNILISHNEIREVSYTGISLGWGWNNNPVVMRDNKVHANHIWNYAKHMYDVAGIYTLGNQPGTMITENYIHDIYTPGYVHIPSHWFYLYADEGSSFITVKDNWTEGDKFLQNANGPGNVWENNGSMVNDSVKVNAGPLKEFQYLFN
ncbi:MAG: right-handed parallel beta-helix repeat-containing protein [Fermentimonas sp.]|nr:right-handed parallel beta-helix repeat-containing protein [Fermentimonas sp.]MDD4696007.1 right-handed parallel beta-helix repeat-containing protein [Fermentimonas sp.]